MLCKSDRVTKGHLDMSRDIGTNLHTDGHIDWAETKGAGFDVPSKSGVEHTV